MHDDILIIRDKLAKLQSALDQFSAGNRDRLFESRDLIRNLEDRVAGSPWRYAAPVCEAVQKILSNVLRHGGLTEEDSIELSGELLRFVKALLDMPVPGLGHPQLVRGSGPASIMASQPAEHGEPDYEPKGEPIKVSLGMVDESRLGEILARMGHLTQDQLHQALALQQVCRKRLGEVLVSMNLIDEDTLEQALDQQRLVTLAMATGMAAQKGSLELKVASDELHRAG